MPRVCFPSPVAVVAALLFSASIALAADANLAELVPADAGLCLSARDLATAGDEFLAGPLARRLTSLKPVDAWKRDNVPALKGIAGQIGEQIGVPFDDAWRGVFGRNSLLAIWPPAAPGKGDGPGLLLVEARDEQLLARLIRGICDAQQRAGEVEAAEERNHAGVAFQWRRLKKGDVRSQAGIASIGRIGLLSNDEQLLRRVLSMNIAPANQRESLANLLVWQQAKERLPPRASLALFVNPRPWDDHIQAALARKVVSPAERRWQLEAWQAARYGVASLDAAPDLAISAHLHFEQLPAGNPLAETLASFSGEAEFTRRAPSDAVLAIAGRVDIGRWLKTAVVATKLAEPKPEDSKLPRPPSKAERGANALLAGWKFVDAMFDELGPNWGLSIRRGSEELDEAPIEAAIGVEVLRRTPDSELIPRGNALRDFLQSLLTLSSPATKRGQAQPAWETEDVSGVTVARLANWALLPPPFAPALACHHRWLAAGLPSLAAVRGVQPSSASNLASEPRFAAMLAKTCERPGQLVYLDVAAARLLIEKHVEPISKLVSQANGLDPSRATSAVAQLSGLLGVADRLLAAARVEPNDVTVAIRLAADE